MNGGAGAGGSFMAGSIVGKLVIDKSQWDAAMASAMADNKAITRSAEQVSRSFMSAGRELSVLGGLIVAFAGVSVAAFTKFDDAMTQSTAIMGDLSVNTKKALASTAREIAKQTTFSSTAAAKAYYYLASAGMSAKESMAALPAVAKFAQAGMFDLERATTLLADAQTSLGLRVRDDAVKNMENMVRVSDVLSKANILANASIEQFSEALTTRAGAALRLVGKDIEEGAAALAVMANQGIKGAEAGTRLDVVLRDLQTRAIKNQGVFEKYNVTVFDTQGEMRNLADIFEDLQGAMAGVSDEKRRSILMEMEFQDRSVASILALVGMSDELRRYEKELRGAGGTTEEIANKQLQSLKSQFKLTTNAIASFAESIGETLAPIMTDLNKLIQGAVNGMTGFIEKNKGFVGAMTIATTAFGGITLATGGALMMTGRMLASWAAIQATAPMTAAALAQIGVALGAFGSALLAAAVGFAAFKFGEWLFKVTGINKVVQAAAGGIIKLGQAVGLVRKPVEELEASEDRLGRRHLFLATASGIAGHEVTNLLEAVKILKKEFAEKGTVGDLGLDTWLAKVKIASMAAKEFRSPLEALNNIIPGLGSKLENLGGNIKGWLSSIPEVTKWWKDLGDKMRPISDKEKATAEAIAAIFKKYETEGRSTLQEALKSAQDDLEMLKMSAEATPAAIKAIENKIKEYQDQLSGFSASQERAKTLLGQVTRTLEGYKKAWSEAVGIDFDELYKFKKDLAEGAVVLPTDIMEAGDEAWAGFWKNMEDKAKDGKAVVEGILGDLVEKATNAGHASSAGIQEAMKSLTEGGTLSEVKLRIAEIEQVLGDKTGLTIERIRDLEEELRRLKGILSDSTPWGKFISGVAESFRMLQTMVDPILQQISFNSQTAVENDYKKRLDYINRTVTDEEAKQKAIEALEAEYQIKKTKAAQQAAIAGKAFSLAQAIINTAEAVTKALAQGGFLAGPIWAAVVGALGAVQIAAIASQPIPLAEGATFDKPTILQNVLTGENRREHMLDEPKLIEVVQQAIEKPRFTRAPALQPALAGIGGSGLTVNFNSPLIHATGYSRRDLERAGEQIKEIVTGQLRRVGRRS